MQYTIDTINIEIGRLHKAIRRFKTLSPDPEQESQMQERITEFEGQIRELRKAIGILKEYVRSNTQPAQYTSRYTETPPSRYVDPNAPR